MRRSKSNGSRFRLPFFSALVGLIVVQPDSLALTG